MSVEIEPRLYGRFGTRIAIKLFSWFVWRKLEAAAHPTELVHLQLPHDVESSANVEDRAQAHICRKPPFKMCNYQEAGDYLQATVHFFPLCGLTAGG